MVRSLSAVLGSAKVSSAPCSIGRRARRAVRVVAARMAERFGLPVVHVAAP
jgi:hypothetical protein